MATAGKEGTGSCVIKKASQERASDNFTYVDGGHKDHKPGKFVNICENICILLFLKVRISISFGFFSFSIFLPPTSS